MRRYILFAYTCAGQSAAQLSVFAALQRRRAPPSLLLVASLALETARGIGSRGQLETGSGFTRVAGTALHASRECLVRGALNLCKSRIRAHIRVEESSSLNKDAIAQSLPKYTHRPASLFQSVLLS